MTKKEVNKKTDYAKEFEAQFGNPIEQVDKLIKKAGELKNKKNIDIESTTSPLNHFFSFFEKRA